MQMMCEDGDLKEMGVPLGPRKKLLSHLHELKQKQVLFRSTLASELDSTDQLSVMIPVFVDRN